MSVDGKIPEYCTIPDDVLIPAVESVRDERGTYGYDALACVTYDMECVRCRCGTVYAAVPIDDIRLRTVTLRKAGKLKPWCKDDDGNGSDKPPKKKPQPPQWYIDYLNSVHWLQFIRIVRDFYGHKCGLCNKPARDGHHRTYERLGCEQLQDVILLCRRCHDKHHDDMTETPNEDPRQ